MKHLGTCSLDTNRLHLRRYRIEDAQGAYENWLSDPQVSRYMRWSPHGALKETVAYLQRLIPQYENMDFYRWIIIEKDSGLAIGTIGFYMVSEIDSVAYVAYALSRAYWNRGIITEALQAVLCFAFTRVGVNRMESYHATANHASGKVMQKAGMRYEGHARQKYMGHHGFEDCELYAMLADDWKVLQH